MATTLMETLVPHERRRKSDASAPLNVDDKDWWWVPAVLAIVFVSFLIMSKKSAWFGGKSLRFYLMKYFSIETLYTTLEGESTHHFIEQRDIEYGHLSLTLLACLCICIDWATNENRDARYVVVALTTIQLILFVVATAVDLALLKLGYVRSVRSVNTKLRWAHCVYQVVLFCTDAISTEFDLHLPVDCFMWATIHYTYEAVGLALEGLNVIGMSEFAIILLLNFKLVTSATASDGWRIAFGISSLALSSVSIIGGMAWKLTHLELMPPDDHQHHGGARRHATNGSDDDTASNVEASSLGDASRPLMLPHREAGGHRQHKARSQQHDYGGAQSRDESVLTIPPPTASDRVSNAPSSTFATAQRDDDATTRAEDASQRADE